MLPRTLTAAAVAAVAVLPLPANATGIGFAASGSLAVASDLSACATVVLPHRATAVGTFSAVGAVAGPGTFVGAVRGATPIVLVDQSYWHGCVAGAYPGAVVGEAVYVLALASATGDYVSTTTCSVRSGAVTCA